MGVPAGIQGIARQAGSVLVTLSGLLALTFFMGRMLPTDPVLAIIGQQADQAAYDMVHHQLGLDRPLPVQFALYVRDMPTGDFGNALFTGHRVAADLSRAFPATIELASLAILIGVGLGVPVGVLAAVYRGTLFDHAARVVSLVGYSSPTFWLGLMGLILFYATLGWVGGPGRLDVAFIDSVEPHTGLLLVDALWDGDPDVFWNAASHIVLPASILGYGSMAYISRMTRSFMLEQLAQEYITAARVKGMSRWAVIRRHAFLLEGAVLTETVFAWPGFGRYLTAGLLAGDMNAVLACVLIVGVIFIGLNLLTDRLYRVLDPRTR